MKVLSKLIIVLLLVGSIGCQQNESVLPDNELIEVSFSHETYGDESNGNGRTEADIPTSVNLSIREVASGDIVENNIRLDLVNINGRLVTRPVVLPVGDYELTDYRVNDDEDNVIYIAPLQFSPLANLVENPLPLRFSVSKDATNQFTPDVYSTQEATAADFGYTDFDFNVSETFSFLIAALYTDDNTQAHELTDGGVRILADNVVLFDSEISAITNAIRIRDGFANYTIYTEKSGFLTDERTIDSATLKGHFSDPLMIFLNPDTENLEVFARENSSTGGQGLVVSGFNPGDSIQFSANPQDIWKLSDNGEFLLNADGAGIDAHVHSQGDYTFATGSLVGSTDNGSSFFSIGTNGTAVIPATGELRLYCWDSDFENNSGFIKVSTTKLN